MKHTLLLATVVGLLTLARASAEPELKGSAAELTTYLAGLPKLVTVTGEAEIKVPADRASVSLRVRTENKSLQEAMRLNQDLREQVSAFLGKHGIEASRIHSSRFASAQRFGMFSEKAKSHQVEHVLKVNVRDEKEFQAVAGAVDKWQEVRYGGTEFEHSDKETLKSKALSQAFDQVSNRKKVIEEKLGVKLTPKRFTQEAVGQVLRNKMPEYAGGQDLAARSKTAESVLYHTALADEGQSAFGELVYSARVHLEYSLESK